MSGRSFDRRSFLKATGGTAAVGLVAGCSGNGGGDGGETTTAGGGGGTTTTTSGGGGGGEGAVTIGSIQPLSGPFAPWGKAHAPGLKYAVEEINADGGVLDGRELKVVEANSKGDPAEASSIFDRFAEQNDIVAATGPVNSDVGIRTSRRAQELGIPILMHMAGSDRVITKDTKHTFRVGLLPAATTMKAQAQLVSDAGYTKVGAIVADFAWGQSVKAGIENSFDVEVNIQVAPIGASDFSSYIRKMPQDLEMMIATGHPPGTVTIANQVYSLGYNPEVLTGPGLPPGVIHSALGENASRLTHLHLSDVYSDEFAQVAERYGNDVGKQFNTHTAYGYVTGKMIAQAIENAGEATPAAVTKEIRNIQFDTLYAEPIQYSEYGELKNQVQLYSKLTSEAPSYYPDGKYGFEEVFRTDTLPALPADE